MKRSKMLLAAVASGAVLSAAAVPTALAMTGVKTQATAQKAPPSNGGAMCGYPSSRTPAVTLQASPTSVRPGRDTVLSGTLSSNKCPITNTPVGLYTVAANGNKTQVAEVLTTSTGAFSFPVQKPRTTTTYVAMSVASQFYDAAFSNTVTVTVTR